MWTAGECLASLWSGETERTEEQVIQAGAGALYVAGWMNLVEQAIRSLGRG